MYIMIREGNESIYDDRYPVLCHNGLALGSSKFEEECAYETLNEVKEEQLNISKQYPNYKYRIFKIEECS